MSRKSFSVQSAADRTSSPMNSLRIASEKIRHKKNLSAHELFTKLTKEDDWEELLVNILPLFNGEGLLFPVEKLSKQFQ